MTLVCQSVGQSLTPPSQSAILLSLESVFGVFFSVLLGLIVNGTLGGWLWIAAGATAVIAFANAEKRYKQLTNK